MGPKPYPNPGTYRPHGREYGQQRRHHRTLATLVRRTSAQSDGHRPAGVCDFTAAWCITCQYNKRNALADPALLADFAAKNVQLLRADWTRRDPAITAALTELGRSGVPVYVLHAPGKAPVVFTEILRVDEVRQALTAL